MVKTEELDKIDNELIFIERDTALKETEMDDKLRIQRGVRDTPDDNLVRYAMR